MPINIPETIDTPINNKAMTQYRISPSFFRELCKCLPLLADFMRFIISQRIMDSAMNCTQVRQYDKLKITLGVLFMAKGLPYYNDSKRNPEKEFLLLLIHYTFANNVKYIYPQAVCLCIQVLRGDKAHYCALRNRRAASPVTRYASRACANGVKARDCVAVQVYNLRMLVYQKTTACV